MYIHLRQVFHLNVVADHDVSTSSNYKGFSATCTTSPSLRSAKKWTFCTHWVSSKCHFRARAPHTQRRVENHTQLFDMRLLNVIEVDTTGLHLNAMETKTTDERGALQRCILNKLWKKKSWRMRANWVGSVSQHACTWNNADRTVANV